MLTTFSDAEKTQYIENTFGKDILKKVKNIHRGGQSAAKGQKYEDLFTLYKVLEIASSHNQWEQHRLSKQGLDFFDDICYEDFETNTKHNYQAKNSSLAAVANWNNEHTSRAKSQIQIDLGFHKANSSQNYLVVSSEERHQENIKKIPTELLETCHSVYFPYHSDNFTKYVTEQLAEMLTKLIHSENSSDHEYAANLLLGILTNTDKPRTIKEIFAKADSNGFPNPFQKTEEIPTWFKELLENNKQLTYQINGAFLVVVYEFFEIKIPIAEIVKSNIQETRDITDLSSLIKYLMQISAKSLAGLEHE